MTIQQLALSHQTRTARANAHVLVPHDVNVEKIVESAITAEEAVPMYSPHGSRFIK